MEATKQFLCSGDSSTFTDVSYHGVVSRTWTFQGGTPTTSSQEVVSVTYNTPGVYEVQLSVTDATGTQSITKTNYIEVFETPANRTALLEGFEGMNSLENSHWFTDNVEEGWGIAGNTGRNSDQSVVLTNFNNFSGRVTNLISKPIDVSNANNLSLSFDYAFSKKSADPTSDRLRVSVSKNCGKTWLTRKTISASYLSSVNSFVTTAFVPTNSEWKHVSVTNISSSYFSNKLMVKFEFKSGGGNNVYIDNVNLFDPAWTGLGEHIEQHMHIYPNPASNKVSLEFNEEINNPHICIYDLSGKLILEKIEQGKLNKVNLNIQHLAKGIYIVEMNAMRTKLIIDL